jgi:hypothetical protein
MKKLFVASTLVLFATAAIAHAEEKAVPAGATPTTPVVAAPAVEAAPMGDKKVAAAAKGKKKAKKTETK